MLKFSRSEFSNWLDLVKTSASGTIREAPVFRAVLIKPEESNKVSMCCSDSFSYMKVSGIEVLEVVGGGEETFVVDVTSLSKYVGSCDVSVVSLEKQGGRCIVKANGVLELAEMPLEDFPKMPEIDPNSVVAIDAAAFAGAMVRASKCWSRDLSRVYLEGACLSGGQVYASDRFNGVVSSVKGVAVDMILKGNVQTIVSVGEQGELWLGRSVDEGWVYVARDNIQLFFRSVGKVVDFPVSEFESICSKAVEENTAWLKVDPEVFSQVLKRMGMFATKESSCKLTVSSKEAGLLTVGVESLETSERVVESMPCETNLKEEYVIHVGYKHLLSAVEFTEGDIVLKFGSATKPVYLEGDGIRYWFVPKIP